MMFLKKIRILRNVFYFNFGWFVLGILFVAVLPLAAQNVRLGWDPSANPDVLSYNVYRADHIASNFSFVSSVIHPDSTYRDTNLTWGVKYFYVATSVDKFGNESLFSNMIDTTLNLHTKMDHNEFLDQLSENENTPKEFKLFQNNPNPFNSSTRISYNLEQSGYVALNIYNMNGEHICTLVNSYQNAGLQNVVWNGTDTNGDPAPSGVYYIRLKISDQSLMRRVLLVK